MPKAILFDLDGTLVQARESSWRVFAKTNAKFGLGIETQEEYFRLLEGNLFESLRRLANDEERAAEASAHFLELLKEEYDPPFVPGMVDVVKCIAGACALAVVSSNSMSTIRRILTKAGLQHCFSHVFGGDVEPDKRTCVQRFLADADYSINRQCAPAYVEDHRPEDVSEHQVVLVTDTVGDVTHAVECGIRAVGVAWGMHSEEALRAAGAEFVAVWPQELVSYLVPGGVSNESCAFSAPRLGMPTEHGGECSCGGDCSCFDHRDPDLAAASRLRRERRLASSRSLLVRLVGSAQPPPDRPSDWKPTDELLMASLRRIRRSGE
ncbi:HAD family hydrolase [Ectothiorhodospiraceae bacterium WFHF3C12]|nr:HAD family hydrolase [Ectothiorhodospiraceae bacterium WFHF3C12]